MQPENVELRGNNCNHTKQWLLNNLSYKTVL